MTALQMCEETYTTSEQFLDVLICCCCSLAEPLVSLCNSSILSLCCQKNLIPRREKKWFQNLQINLSSFHCKGNSPPQPTFHPHLKPHCVPPLPGLGVESHQTHWKGARGVLLIDHEFQPPHCPWRSPDKLHIPQCLSRNMSPRTD